MMSPKRHSRMDVSETDAVPRLYQRLLVAGLVGVLRRTGCGGRRFKARFHFGNDPLSGVESHVLTDPQLAPRALEQIADPQRSSGVAQRLPGGVFVGGFGGRAL